MEIYHQRTAAAIGVFTAGEGKLFAKGGVFAVEGGDKWFSHTVTDANGDTIVYANYHSTKEGVQAGEKSIISPEVEEKILSGQRIDGSNKIIGGHSSTINNINSKYAVDEIKVNSDGTKTVKYTTQFEDGSLSKIKTSTLFPESWSDKSIIDSIKQVGNNPIIGQRASTGETLHRGVINGVEIDVIKKGDSIIAGYPVGGKPTVGFEATK